MEAMLEVACSESMDAAIAVENPAPMESMPVAPLATMQLPGHGVDVLTANGWSSGIDAVSAMAVRLLAADACMIMLIAGNVGGRTTFRTHCSPLPGDVSAERHQIRRGENAARRALRADRPMLLNGRSCDRDSTAAPLAERIAVAPIRIGAEGVGAIGFFTLDRTRGDAALLAATEIVASLVGQSLHALRLETILHSRFAQLALFAAGGDKAEEALSVARGGVGRLTRILAKSFYREMVRLGCDSGQIVEAASEIISQLSGSLKKHRDRLHRTREAEVAGR